MNRNQTSPFIAANNKILEAEAAKTSPTTTAAPSGGEPTSTTTTAAPSGAQGGGQTSTTTTVAPSGNQPTTTTTTKAISGDAGGAPTSTTTTQAELTEDERTLNYMRKVTGNDALTMEEMLTSLKRKAPLTPEEETQLNNQKELDLQAAFVKQGKGSIDDFHRIRNLAKMEDIDIVREEFYASARELDPAITDARLEQAFNDAYFLDDTAGYSDAEKKVGQKYLKARADQLRSEAGKPLAEVENLLDLDEKARTSANEWNSKVTQYVPTLPKHVSVPIGKIGETEMGDFKYDLNDEEQRDIVESLRDPAWLFKQIADEKTGKTDLTKLANLVITNKVFHKAVKAAASDHYSKGVDSIASTLHNMPNLQNTGGREQDDAAQQRIDGEAQIKQDASNVFGRKNRVKSI